MSDICSKVNSPFQGQTKYPDRCKLLIWNTKDKSIKEIRKIFNIEKNIIMRYRGKHPFYRIEVWCKTRKEATNLKIINTGNAKNHKFHLSLGTSYRDRQNKNNKEKQKAAHVKIMQWNARSLRNKFSELKQEIEIRDPTVICIQESYLNPQIEKNFGIKGYAFINANREHRRGGGVTTIVKDSTPVKSFNIINNANIEGIQLVIQPVGGFELTIVNIYIPPNNTINKDDLDQISPRSKNVIIVGDFNSRHSLWNYGPENSNGVILKEWLTLNKIILLNNKEITYQSPSYGTTSTLDLTLVTPNIYEKVTEWFVGEDLQSDHLPVYTTITFNNNIHFVDNKVPRTKWKIRDANWEKFQTSTETLKDASVHHNIELHILKETIISAAESNIPIIKQKPSKPMNIWWTQEINIARKNRISARRRWIRNKIPQYRTEYNRWNAISKRLILTAKRKSWREFVNSMNKNTPSQTVWKHFNAIKGQSSKRMGPLKPTYDSFTKTDYEAATLLATNYSKKSGKTIPYPKFLTKEEQYLSCNIQHLFLQNTSTNSVFTMEELSLALAALKNSATGDDLIHNQMLIHLSTPAKVYMLQIFNDIWKSGKYPTDWKCATIIPILKPNKDKSDPNSYRPVALMSCLGKLLERLVNNRLKWYLEHNNLLNKQQFGFRPNRSTTDALLNITESIYAGFTKNAPTLAITVDLEAAFDKAPATSIILQCAKIGIRGHLLQFINNFLQNREIQVLVNESMSGKHKVDNGTPQGSVLSPTLFNILMFDIASTLPSYSNISIYADDIIVWTTNKNLDLLTRNAQIALNKIDDWANKWSLTISKQKTQYTVFTRKYSLKNHTPVILLKDTPLQYNKTPKILGVFLDEKLYWNHHINHVATECMKRLNLLKIIASRTWGADTIILRQFYLTYIRSKMSYASEVWSSAARTHIVKLQKIQNAALRFCLGCPKTTSIQAMEIELNVMPLDLYFHQRICMKHITNKTLPENTHPSARLAHNVSFAKQSYTHALSQQLEHIENYSPQKIPNISTIPPWEWIKLTISLDLPESLSKQDDIHLLRSVSLNMIGTQYQDFVHIYTDGSLNLEKKKSGAGVYIPTLNEKIYVPTSPLSSMDAELLAIEAALIYTTQLSEKRICILTDSKSALQNLMQYSPTDYFFRTKEIFTIVAYLRKKDYEIVFQWIPSHCNIEGNEIADSIAREASDMTPIPAPYTTLSSSLRNIKDTFIQLWTELWHKSTKGRSLFNILPNPNKLKIYSKQSRRNQTFGARARTGHIVTESYLFKYKIINNPTCKVCNSEEETLQHILLECNNLNPLRDKMRSSVKNGMLEILTNPLYWSIAEQIYVRHREIGNLQAAGLTY